MGKQDWHRYPELPRFKGQRPGPSPLEVRRRHRAVRYLLFLCGTQLERGDDPGSFQEGQPPFPPGFVEFWLGEKPKYVVNHRGEKSPVPHHKERFVGVIGGYASFAKVWDVDEDLHVYLRHRSVWQEWNDRLREIVPVLGSELWA